VYFIRLMNLNFEFREENKKILNFIKVSKKILNF